MEISVAPALVMDAPEFFKDEAFVAWLNNPKALKFTYHQGGQPSKWSDVVVLVDPSLTGEGSDSGEMPDHIWDQIVAECKKRKHALPLATGNHILVWLKNV